MATGGPPRRARGFTRLEACGVLAGVALLALLALPALGGWRSSGDQALCLANFRQLARAWLMYAEDNAGRLPPNLDGGEAQVLSNTNRIWVTGWLDFNGSPANTNIQVLRDSLLGPYLPTVAVFRCPADAALSRGRQGDPRVRSVSMNGYLGPRPQAYSPGYRVFTMLAAIVDPKPAECLLFIDEREDSLNDACFLIDMNGFDPARPSASVWVDYPAARHGGGATTAFVDGHAETWRWLDARTMPVFRPGQSLPLNQPSPNNPDVARVQRAASRRVTASPP